MKKLILPPLAILAILAYACKDEIRTIELYTECGKSRFVVFYMENNIINNT